MRKTVKKRNSLKNLCFATAVVPGRFLVLALLQIKYPSNSKPLLFLAILCVFMFGGLGCQKQCLESVTLPVPVRPEMPESLRTLPRNPCIERPCWYSPDNPKSTSCLTTETEPDYQKWLIENSGYIKACKVYFEHD